MSETTTHRLMTESTGQEILTTLGDISEAVSADTVKYTAQTPTTAQQAQARTNIGAASQDDLDTLNSKFENMFTRKFRTYTNITIPSSEYIKVDSYSDMNVSTDIYTISMNIRGWGGSINGVTLVKGSNGTDFYLVGEANKTITSITVEYIFSRY